MSKSPFTPFIMLIISLLVLNGCTGNVYKVTSPSMEPALPLDSYITVVPVSLSALQRGDIIMYEQRYSEGRSHAKRLIGLPGETIEIRENAIYIDGAVLDESYPVEPFRSFQSHEPITLADDEYYVLGDNRPNSSDSRRIGPISGDEIVGRVMITRWNRFLNALEAE